MLNETFFWNIFGVEIFEMFTVDKDFGGGESQLERNIRFI